MFTYFKCVFIIVVLLLYVLIIQMPVSHIERTPVLSSLHYCDVIITAMASQITSLTIVYSTVYSGADQRTH